VAADVVAVVTLLTRREGAVAAAGELAVVVAAVAVDLVAVVALLARIQVSVAAFEPAGRRAAVAVHGVAVVALLTRVDDAVAAAGELAVVVAAVAVDLVAVVALLTRVDDAVAAAGELAVVVAAVAVVVVCVVARLALVDMPVAAQLDLVDLDLDELIDRVRRGARRGEGGGDQGAGIEVKDAFVEAARPAVDDLGLPSRHVAGVDDEGVIVALADECVDSRAADDD